MLSSGRFASALLGASLTAALVATPHRINSGGSSNIFLPQTAAAEETDEEGDSAGDTATDDSGNPADEGGTDQGNTDDEDAASKAEPTDTGVEPEELLDSGSDEGADPVTGGSDEGTDSVTGDSDEGADLVTNGSDERDDPVTSGDDVTIKDTGVEVQHPNGMREELRNGRYEMFDAQGRVIINRPATEADLARLRALIY